MHSPLGTALVTGARRGIGAATSQALARNGFAVAKVDLVHDEAADETLNLISEEKGRALFIEGDIADLDAHATILNQAAKLGPLTCVVNNAGMQVPVRGDMLETTPDTFDRVLDVNLRGTFFLTQSAARQMVAEKDGDGPRSIVVVSSANAAMSSPEKAAYCLSKSALSMLVKLFATRLAEHGIDVFEIQPGMIKTKMSEAVWETYGSTIAEGKASLTRRWGQPEDVGKVIASLASGKLPFCTGTVVPVGGGLHVHRL